MASNVQLSLENGTHIAIRFGFDPHTLGIVRNLPARRYVEQGGRRWLVPVEYCDKVFEVFPHAWVDKSLSPFRAKRQELETAAKLPDAPHPSDMACALFPYQRADIAFLRKLDSCLNHGEPGIGKTRSAIGWSMSRLDADRGVQHLHGCLVVCPSSTKYFYRDEILRCMPSATVAVVEGRKGEFPPLGADYVVLNWDLLHHRKEQILAHGFACVVFSEAHAAKGHPVGTKILTPYGFKSIEELTLDDFVVGSEGKPIRLLGIHRRGVLPTSSVKFNDNTSITVDNEHLWAVKTGNDIFREKGWRVLSTASLSKNVKRLQGTGRWKYTYRVPTVKSVEFSPRPKLPIDPYLFGVMLGDGNFSHARFTAGNSLTTEEVKNILPPHSILKIEKNKEGSKTWRISSTGGTNLARRAFKSLGVFSCRAWEKFIPKDYLFASVADRISLLQGMMDTDGGRQLKGSDSRGISFCTTSSRLVEDFRFLVQSLGGIATIPNSPTIQSYTYKGVKMVGRPAFRFSLRLPSSIVPFRSHAEGFKPRKKYLEPHRSVHSISPNGNHEVICLTVDSPDGLYVTEEFIVTHNSGSASLRGQAAIDIGAAIGRRHCETGSPVRNRPRELAPLLQILGKLHKNEVFRWLLRFCNGHQQTIFIKGKPKKIWDFSGASHQDELAAILRQFSIGRRKKDVFGEIPPITYSFPLVDLANRAEYDRALNEMFALKDRMAKEKDEDEARRLGGEILGFRVRLHQLGALGKVDSTIEQVQQSLGENLKTVVFCDYLEPLYRVQAAFGDAAVLIEGALSPEEKYEAANSFQSEPAKRLCLCSPAGYYGVTLTAASTVIFMSVPYVPEDWKQARDRAAIRADNLNRSNIHCMTLLARKSMDIAQASLMYEKSSVIEPLVWHDREDREMIARFADMVEVLAGRPPRRSNENIRT